MLRLAIFLTFLCYIFASVVAFQPTPIQQFLIIPQDSYNFGSPAWHIGDDIVTFYQSKSGDLSEGYLKISHKTSQVERILVDTVASCQRNVALLDRSYYHPSTGTFLYYCVANNSLLSIGQDYTVQDAIPISTSQTFSEVILGHNEQGYVTILGLPDLLSLPAKKPTELILVDLKTKAVENHIVFKNGSDSQVFVTGYAFDSDGVSYIQTKGLEGGQTVIRISEIVLSENDYELIPFAYFTYNEGLAHGFYHNRLHIVDGYIFTNDDYYLIIFDKDGNLYQGQADLNFLPMRKNKTKRLLIPQAAAQIGGLTLYARSGGQGQAFSLQNGKMASSVVDYSSDGMLVALGGRDLLIGLDYDTFDIKDPKTNMTLYTSFREINDMIVSDSYYAVLKYDKFYVFDRKKSGQLLKIIPAPGFNYHDKTTNLLVGLSRTGSACQVTYTDLETLNVTNGPIISQAACGIIRHVDLKNLTIPFFITNPVGLDHYIISPATYGEFYWKYPILQPAEGILVPGDNANHFFYVWNPLGNHDKIYVETYRYIQQDNTYPLWDAYHINTDETNEKTQYFNIGNCKLILSYAKSITVVDLSRPKLTIYDAPAVYDSKSHRDVGVFYDKNKNPYVSLWEVQKKFGTKTTAPQLFDGNNDMKTMPGVIPNLTRTAMAVGNCSYGLVDEFDNTIGVVRLYDICGEAQGKTEKINI